MYKSICIFFTCVIAGQLPAQVMQTANKKTTASLTVTQALNNLPRPPKTKHQVLILGSPHFDLGSNSSDWKSKTDIDMRSPGRQQQIERIVEALKNFRPTRICIEWEPSNDSLFTARYQKYVAGNYTLPAGEYYQLGFRLAKLSGHTKLYCIDNKPPQLPSILEIDDFDKYLAEQGSVNLSERTMYDSLNEKHNRYLDSVKGLMTLKDYLLFLNTDEVRKQSKRIWLTGLVHAGNKTTYAGADLTGHWYQRNTRIFSNVKKICTAPSERILIIYGQMHAFVLEELFRGSQEFEIVPVNRYLK